MINPGIWRHSVDIFQQEVCLVQGLFSSLL